MARKALIHQIEARERRGRWFGALATLLSISLLLSGWVGLFAFLGANSAYGTFQAIADEWVPDTRSMDLTLPDLSRVSRVYAETGEVLAELHNGRNSEPIPYHQVPEVMIHAILAAEDSEFFEHEGIDFTAIASAALDNLLYDQTRGGSTITQQVVKNAFVGSEISIRRKVNEAFVSAEAERRFPKERLLEYYMNSVYFGAGAYGVKTAAEEFFNKPLDEVQIHEAAALAVLVRNPSLYNPRHRPELVLERRDGVIEQMLDKGWINEAQATYAQSRPLDVVDTPPRRGEADHVVAEVRRQLLNSPEFAFLGETREDRIQAIFGCPADDVACEGGGGLQIYTTIDLRLQKAANEVLHEWLPLPPYEENLAACARVFPDYEDNPDFYARYAETHSCEPTGAIAMVDNHTGAVKVMASGLDFEFNQFDLAVQGRRNTGSAFKAIGLAAALEQGFTLGHRWDGASPMEVECEFICSPQGTNVWTVHNANRSSAGVITLDEATSRSTNTVYAQVSLDTGPENIVDMARRMGITEAALEPVLSIVLGSSSVSPMEMASAFSNFATNGRHANDYIVERIVSHEGEVIYEKEPEITQVADPALFAAARRPLLRVPTSGGTAPRADIGRLAGGKTGTHQSYLDAWYVGFTPEYSTAVWVGYESEQIPLANVVIAGQNYSRVFGGTVPAPIWADFMRIVMDGLPETQFPADPPNVEEYVVPPQTTVPAVVGLTERAAVNALRTDAKLNVSVQRVPSLEPEGIVFRQSIGAGATVPQGTTVTIWVSNGETPTGTLPDFRGMTLAQAEEAAGEFTLATNVVLALSPVEVPVDDPNRFGVIVDTNPAPGASVSGSVSVTVMIGAQPQDDGGDDDDDD
jgi:penicillin-binding protein 1A